MNSDNLAVHIPGFLPHNETVIHLHNKESPEHLWCIKGMKRK